MGGSCILHLGVGVIKMMEDVLDQSISDETGSREPLIIILPTCPRLVVGARVNWQQFFC